MRRPDRNRVAVEHAVVLARMVAGFGHPTSPSWDAAMGLADELEGKLRQLNEERAGVPVGARPGRLTTRSKDPPYRASSSC